MWEQAMMSRSRVTRSLSRRSGSSKGQAPTSPAWTPSPEARQTENPERQTNEIADSKLLANLRRHLSHFEQLCNLNQTPLSDHRVLGIRKEVETAMPRVYALSDEKNGGPISSEACTVRNLAEVFLRRFPDINMDTLRLNTTTETADMSTANVTSPPQSTPAHVNSSARFSASENHSHVNLPKNQERDHCHASNSQDDQTESNSTDAVVTPAQQTVLHAIQDLLDNTGRTSDVQRSYLNAPAAESLDRLQQIYNQAGNYPFTHNIH